MDHFENGRQKAERVINAMRPISGGSISSALYGDLKRANDSKRDAGKEWILHRLNADGRPSGMHDAQTKWNSEEEALGKVKLWRSLNPGRKLRYSLNGKEV